MSRYLFYNGPMQTTAAPVPVTTGAATLKTMLQVKPFTPARIVGWGYSFDASAAGTPGTVELIETDVAATVTAFADADITKLNDPGDAVAASVAGLTLGTSSSGYTATVEGTTASLRNLDAPQLVAPTSQVIYQSPLGFEAKIQVAKFARIRMKFTVAVNAFCWMIVEI